jgi:hypothetical protein
MLDDVDANEVGDGGTSDAEGDGYECVVYLYYKRLKCVVVIVVVGVCVP